MNASSPPAPSSGPTVTVIRGTFQANLPELAIYAHLKGHGFRPELLGARHSSYADEEVGMPVRRLPTPRLLGPLSKTVAGGYLLGRVSPYRYYHEFLQGFDTAVAQSDILVPVDLGHPTSYQALLQRPRAKVVVQVWDNIPFNWPKDRPLARHYEAVLQQADLFIPFTRDADRVLSEEGVGPDRRVQVYPGLDRTQFRPPTPEERKTSRAGLGARDDEVVVSFVGRVEAYKGILTLVEALPKSDPKVRLHVFGEGAARASAERRAAELGVEGRIRFWGAVPHRDLLRRVLWGSDALAVPSIPTEQWREQFGQVFIEAMAAGLPVVGSRSGAVPEVIEHGVNGLLVPPDSPDELSSALTRLAQEPEARTTWGMAGQRTVEEKFDDRTNAATLATVLWERVLHRTPP